MRSNDLPVLTSAELGRAYEELRDRLMDYNGVYADQLNARLTEIMNELHDRALDING